MKYVLFIFLTNLPLVVQANDCISWFLDSGLASKTVECSLKCSVTPVDMGTFTCPAQCEELCSKTTAEKLLTYVPRLTEGDKIVISKMPLEAVKVFKEKAKLFLSAHAEDSTQNSEEKKMDIFNNELGIKYFLDTKSKGKTLELDEIESEALKLLKNKKLKVISPQYEVIPGGYYSK